MTLPRETITVLDPGLGLVDVAAVTPIETGVSSAGTVGQLYSFSSLSTIRATLGYGDLPDSVAKKLNERGGPVLAMRGTGSTAATSSAVTKIGTGTPTPTIAGVATMRIKAQVRVRAGGALGTATFDFALDNWQPTLVQPTFGATRTIPGGGSFLFPNSGITMTFPAGTYVAGDTFNFTCEPAHLNASDVSALGALIAAIPSAAFKIWSVSDSFTTATEGYAVAVALGSALQTLAGNFRYSGGFVDVGSGDTSANVLIGDATFADVRISPCYGFELQAAALAFEGYGSRYTSCVNSIAARAARVAPSTDLARFAEGNLNGTQWIALDSSLDGTVDAAGISTLRTWPNANGFYIANGNIAAPIGSDFQLWQYRTLMDLGCQAVYTAMLPFLADDLRTLAAGTLDPLEAGIINTAGLEALNEALMRPKNARGRPGLVSAVSFAADLTNNINLTSQLNTTIAIRPRGYSRFISQTIGYSLSAGA